MFVKLLIISAIFLAISFAGLGIRLLIKPGSRFPEFHVGRNKEMQKRGITCARKTDLGCTVSIDNKKCIDCLGSEE